jgi:hypothetical protein
MPQLQRWEVDTLVARFQERPLDATGNQDPRAAAAAAGGSGWVEYGPLVRELEAAAEGSYWEAPSGGRSAAAAGGAEVLGAAAGWAAGAPSMADLGLSLARGRDRRLRARRGGGGGGGGGYGDESFRGEEHDVFGGEHDDGYGYGDGDGDGGGEQGDEGHSAARVGALFRALVAFCRPRPAAGAAASATPTMPGRRAGLSTEVGGEQSLNVPWW